MKTLLRFKFRGTKITLYLDWYTGCLRERPDRWSERFRGQLYTYISFGPFVLVLDRPAPNLDEAARLRQKWPPIKSRSAQEPKS